MAEFFKIFGIAMCVLFADVLFFGILLFIKVWNINDDDAFVLPAVLNGLWLAICAAILISQWIS